MGFKRKFYKFKRKQEIKAILTKHGLGYFIDKSHWRLMRLVKQKFRGSDHSTLAEKLRLAIEELGPTFIKFGQILSTRSDILPAVFIQELEKLQDQTIPFDGLQAREIVRKELKQPLKEIFKDFEKDPVAAASLSQVHRAILLNGDVVAVKVQRPNIEEIIDLDLEILENLMVLFDAYIYKKWYFHPQIIIKEIRKTLKKEVDFVNEAYNFERFSRNFKKIEHIKTPKIYWKLTTKKVLIMQYIKGVKINKINDKKYKNIFDCQKVAQLEVEMILKQIFEDRFFHADPHPANLFIIPPKTIVILDVGMVGIVDEQTAKAGLILLNGFINNDLEQIIQAFEGLGIVKETTDKELLRHNIMEMVNKYAGILVENLRIKKIGEDVLEIIRENKLIMPTNLILIFKSLAMTETTVKQLDPNFLIMPSIKDFLQNLLKQQFSLLVLKKQAVRFLQESVELIERLPRDLTNILDKLKNNKLQFKFESHQIEKLSQEIKQSNYERLIGLIIVAFIISGSLFLIYETQPLWRGYSIFGFIGYFISFFLVILLLILRKNRKL